MQRRSLIEYLERFYRRGPQIAYAHRRGYRVLRWSYREVAERASQFARELEARGIGRGDRVLIWGENCAEWIVAFFGSLLRGAVVAPMDRIASADFALRVARQVEAKLLVCSPQQARLAPAFPTLVLDNLRETISHHSRAPYPAPDLGREDTVELVFTSGTTADPKGVLISHGNILASLEPLETEIQKYLKYERVFHPIRFLNLLPLSHVFGQFLGIFVPQLLGGVVIFQDTLNPSEMIRVIRRERVSVLVAVPRLLETLREKVERDFQARGRLDWLRQQLRAAEGEHFVRRWWRFRRIHNQFGWKFWALISGGAALDSGTEAFWRLLSFAVIQGYGLTETTALVSVNHPFRLGRGSIGKVLPGREVKLDESGEILVRGESVVPGVERDREGWFATGDRGELDAQGNLYFRGRKKNVIVTPEGLNVYPEDLEAALRRQPEVRDCVVVGLARGGNAEACAVLILRGGCDPQPVVRRANASLAEYQHMRHWFVWPDQDFPRTSTQKPRTNVIQEIVQVRMARATSRRALPQSGTATATPAANLPSSPLADLIGRITRRPPAALQADANLATDLNLSSVDRVELLSALEDRYQMDLDETRFTAVTTVGELEQMLRQPASVRAGYSYPRWPQRWPVTWIRWLVYYLLVWPATMLLAYPQVRGRENLRGVSGPVLVVANHIASVDIGFVLAALPRRLRGRLAVAMEGERLRDMRNPPAELGFFTRWLDRISYWLAVGLFNVFPLPQKTGFRESFLFAGEAADRGYSILVFPEGQRTPDGGMRPFRAGIGLLANNLAIPVVPVRIDGLFPLRQAGKTMAPPGAVRITMGSPVRFDPNTDPALVARELESRVRALEKRT